MSDVQCLIVAQGLLLCALLSQLGRIVHWHSTFSSNKTWQWLTRQIYAPGVRSSRGKRHRRLTFITCMKMQHWTFRKSMVSICSCLQTREFLRFLPCVGLLSCQSLLWHAAHQGAAGHSLHAHRLLHGGAAQRSWRLCLLRAQPRAHHDGRLLRCLLRQRLCVGLRHRQHHHLHYVCVHDGKLGGMIILILYVFMMVSW